MPETVKLTLGNATIGFTKESVKATKRADWIKMIADANKRLKVDAQTLETKLGEAYDEIKGTGKKETSKPKEEVVAVP